MWEKTLISSPTVAMDVCSPEIPVRVFREIGLKSVREQTLIVELDAIGESGLDCFPPQWQAHVIAFLPQRDLVREAW